MLVPKGKQLSVETLRHYVDELPNKNRTVQVKFGNMFLRIYDISVDVGGNVILYSEEEVIEPFDPFRNFMA